MVGKGKEGTREKKEGGEKMFKDTASLHKYLNILRACFNPFYVG